VIGPSGTASGPDTRPIRRGPPVEAGVGLTGGTQEWLLRCDHKRKIPQGGSTHTSTPPRYFGLGEGVRCMNLRGREGADIFLTVERTIATKKRLIGCQAAT
jgi:hypothetical protein